MLESEGGLRHLQFFEEISSLTDDDPDLRAATAGLVVLRLVDAWIEEGAAAFAEDGWTLRNVEAAIEDVNDGSPIRALLFGVVDSLRNRKNVRGVVTPLMAYAQALEYDAKWRLAADVYHTLLAHVHPADDADASVAAHLRLGQCYRNLSSHNEAARAFASASRIASAAGDLVGVLRARIGEARLAIIKGNLPDAEALLDATIERAVGESMQDVRSRALHDRANVAHFRQQYELSIQLAYEALELSQIQTEKDRILGDIAVSFLELGVYSAARDAYMVLSATAQEQYTRWAATLNLLEIASLTGRETLFELYRRELAASELPPYMQTAFEMNLGTGYRQFGDLARARRHLERAITMAEEHGFNQYLFAAEKALFDLDTPSARPKATAALTLDTEEIAKAIQGLREMAGV